MAEAEKKRNVLLHLAAEGVVPVLGGCAGAAAAGPVGGVAGVAVGHAVEKAINLFGRGIVGRWQEWLAGHPADARAAVAELAATPPADAREEAKSVFLELAPGADEDDLLFALEYISAIPPALDRALIPDPAAPGGKSVPPTVALDDPRSLLQLLPADVPPYRPASDLSGTPYRLGELLGAGGFGAVYRASAATLQHLPLAIKFCLDRGLLPALNQERSNLERLMRAGGRGSGHVVRLYGYDLDHPTPYLVYEYVDGGDLTKRLAARRPSPAEVLGWVEQVAAGLAFAHRVGLVHRDLKPANILVEERGDGAFALKLADFGLGGVAAARAAVRSRIGTSTVDYLSLADQASLFRGAGTPLYMSPEQRRGMPPDPRHDLYALGVVWYQLLVGDVSRELHHGWAKELAVRFGVPAGHIGVIERCVGWFDERPKDANELLPLLREVQADPTPQPPPRVGEGEPDQTPPVLPPLPGSGRGLGGGVLSETRVNASQVTPVPSGVGDGRRRGLAAALARLAEVYAERDALARRPDRSVRNGLLSGLLVGWLLGEFVYAVRLDTGYFPAAFRGPSFDWLSVLLGAAGGAAACGMYTWFARAGMHGAAFGLNQAAEAQVGEIASDFPAEVAGWGGRQALRHPPTVRRLREDLDPPAPKPAPAPLTGPGYEDVAADPTKKVLLVARLRDHDKALDAAGDAVNYTWFGVVFLGFLAAVGAGVGSYHAVVEPAARGNGVYHYYNQGPATVAAVVAAPAAFGLVYWLMWLVRRHFRRRAEASLERFAADYPRLVDGWGGRRVLESRETVGALITTLDPASADRKGWAWWLGRAFGR